MVKQAWYIFIVKLLHTTIDRLWSKDMLEMITNMHTRKVVKRSKVKYLMAGGCCGAVY